MSGAWRRIASHHIPPPERQWADWIAEPEGERIRAELEDFLTRNKIVGMVLDTQKHTVTVDIVRLPPYIKSVLTKWGSVYVVDEERANESERKSNQGNVAASDSTGSEPRSG